VSLGIIVTELATNAVKYAWPGGHPGRLVVRLEAEGHGRACLVVEDDGEGMDRGGTARGTGLGRRLVRAMTDTLGGTVETVPRQAGTCVAVRFPL
jgi:two-component sensor histidine kinase